MQSGSPFARSRLRGALFGAIVGDALSFPHQHHSRAYLRSLGSRVVVEYQEHFSGLHPRGQVSVLSQELLAALEGLLEDGGVAGDSLLFRLESLWQGADLVHRDTPIERPTGRAARRERPFRSPSPPGLADAGPLVRALPAALLAPDAESPWRENVEACLRHTHSDPRVLASGYAIAALLRHNLGSETFLLGPFLDAGAQAAAGLEPALEAAILDFPRILSLSEARALRVIEGLLPDDRYPVGSMGLSDYVVPALLGAVYCFLRHPFSPLKALEGAIGLGGHFGVSACLAGALTGALAGEEGIPQALVEGLVDAASIERSAEALAASSQPEEPPEPASTDEARDASAN